MPQKVNDLIKRYEKKKGERSTWEAHWQELAYYCLPRKRNIITRTVQGAKLPSDVYDSTAAWSLLVFAAGMHSYLTNPASKWFELRLQDEELETKEVQEWLKESEDKIFHVLNMSNFNQQIHETYLDIGCFGTANLYEEEDTEEVVRFYERPVAETYPEENAQERIDTMFRPFEFTVRQAYQTWGKKAGKKVVDKYEAKKYNEKVEILHVVEPRHDFDPGKKDAKNKPFASYYIEISGKHLISEGGYDEFPFHVARSTKLAGEIFGRSTSMVALPDIKMLNQMGKTTIVSAQKVENPPMQGPSDGYILPIDTTPGAMNFREAGVEDRIEPLYDPRVHQIQISLEMQNQRRESIKRAFFVDLFLLLSQRPQMTATEVLERVQEKMLILSPTLGRLMSELLDPIIKRTFNILVRQGRIEVPKSLLKQAPEYKIEYTSPLAKAQKQSEMKSLNSFLAIMGQVAEMRPDILDNINVDEIAKEAHDVHNVTPKVLNSDDEIDKIRQERLEAQQQQQKMEQLQQVVDSYKKVAEAEGKVKNGERKEG